jgi:protocatechuate 3,4-dioxygenase beta subunit
VRYLGRQAPHVHFKVKMKGQREWTTQLFVQGDPGNARDGVYARIGDQAARDSVTVNFAPVKDSRIGELAARFDIVLGLTPHDDHAH